MLASRANISRDKVYQFLTHLRQQKIIDYIPQNRSPFIYFSKERIPVDRLKISKENYDTRKKELIERVEAVINYATCTTRCRSQLLLDYFGESDSPPCGTCDVCKSMENLSLTSFEFEKIGENIQKLLETPISYEKLLLKLKGDQQKMRKVIKWLLDNEKIIYRIDNKLEWKKK